MQIRDLSEESLRDIAAVATEVFDRLDARLTGDPADPESQFGIVLGGETVRLDLDQWLSLGLVLDR